MNTKQYLNYTDANNYEIVVKKGFAVYDPKKNKHPYIRICQDCSSIVVARFTSCPRCKGNNLKLVEPKK